MDTSIIFQCSYHLSLHIFLFSFIHKILNSNIAIVDISTGEKITVKTENCAVVLLCILMDDTPTIDVMWIFLCGFSIYVYFCVQKCRCASLLLCGKPLPARITRIKSTHNFLFLKGMWTNPNLLCSVSDLFFICAPCGHTIIFKFSTFSATDELYEILPSKITHYNNDRIHMWLSVLNFRQAWDLEGTQEVYFL